MPSVAQRISILIADDHPLFRTALRDLLEAEADFAVVAEAAEGNEAIALFREHAPAVSLIDLQMPQLDGLQTIRAIQAIQPGARTLMLTSFAGDARIERAMKFGAAAYVLKTTQPEDLIRTVRETFYGRTTIQAEFAAARARMSTRESLNEREISALQLAATGLCNRDIGRALTVSEETIKSRLKNILHKLAARDRTHAVSIAVRRGFIDP